MGILLLSQMEDLQSQPYGITTAYICHYNDVTWALSRHKSTATLLFVQLCFYSLTAKKTPKLRATDLLYGYSPVTSWLSKQRISDVYNVTTSWRPHVMMTSLNWNMFRVTGSFCGNSLVTGEFPSQRPVTRSFDVFFDLRLNKRLGKQSRRWWFETPSRSLWRPCNATKISQ